MFNRFAPSSGLFAVAAAIAAPAVAQDSPPSETQAPQNQPVTPAAPTTEAKAPPVAVSDQPNPDARKAEAAKFAKFDKLKPQGQTSDIPGTYETITQDMGGWRSALYDKGLFLRGVNVTSFTNNFARGKQPDNPQRYSGQQPTAFSTTDIRGSVRLAQNGDDLIQVNVGVLSVASTWSSVGPTGSQLSRFDVYGSFLDRTIEVTAGIGTNISNFVGIFAGGNPILATGLAGTVPVQVGLSSSTGPTPMMNVTLNGRNGFYSKTGVQRSLVRGGLIAEARGNDFGFNVSRTGAKPLVIQEFGILRPASAKGRQMWVRAGGLYNTTNYNRFDGRGTEKNWLLYALADYQIVKPSAAEPYRGVFVGATAQFAPSTVNAFKQNFEGRIYAIGMVPGRSADSFTLTVGYNGFTRQGGDAIRARGGQARRYQFSVSALYAIHVDRGVFLSPTVTYIKNPVFTGAFRPAANVGVTLTTLY